MGDWTKSALQTVPVTALIVSADLPLWHEVAILAAAFWFKYSFPRTA